MGHIFADLANRTTKFFTPDLSQPSQASWTFVEACSVAFRRPHIRTQQDVGFLNVVSVIEVAAVGFFIPLNPAVHITKMKVQ